MNKAYQDAKILKNERLQEGIYLMKLEGEFKGAPGQFFMVKAWKQDPLLPRPLSICDLDEEGISFLYKVVGRGTAILAEKKPGENIELLGPLGRGFDMQKEGKIALVAGGIGLAPFLYVAKNLKQKPDLIVGFDKNPYFLEEFKPYVDYIEVATEDGSVGTKGYCTQLIQPDKYDAIYVCGPTAMMKAVQQIGGNSEIYLSLENHMACGLGACLGCTVETDQGMLRVCREGPVFRAEEVVL